MVTAQPAMSLVVPIEVHDDPTAAVVGVGAASKSGATLTFRRHVTMPRDAIGFNLYSAPVHRRAIRLNRHLIRTHAGRDYVYPMYWRPRRYRLQTVLAAGGSIRDAI